MNTGPYIVLYDNQYPVCFVQNHQRVHSICHIDDATVFESSDDALVALHDWGLRGNGKFTIQSKPLPAPATP